MGKSLLLKKFMFLSFFIFLLMNEIFGQKALPVYDGINYSAGTLVYDNTNWWCLNGTPVNDVSVTSGSLSFTGLLESTANKLSFGGAGDDFVIWFGDRPADTKIYYSFIFQVTDMSGVGAGTPASFAGFYNTPDISGSFGCSIIIQKDVSDPSKFNIAHGTRSALPVWNTVAGNPVKYSLNTPIFIVACYEIIGTFIDGTPNDKSSMWINPSPSTFENTLPPTANLSGDLTGTGANDINPVNRFYIRQDAASNTPSIDIDEIRIGLTWTSVTPKSLITGTYSISGENTCPTLYPNPVNDVMSIDIKNPGISSFDIHGITGNLLIRKVAYQGSENLDLSSFPKGIYLITFRGQNCTFVKKIIKK
jgi:hypothetical protein